LARAKAASTSASLAACFHAMPSWWSAGAAAGAVAVAAGGAAGAGASLFEQAASAGRHERGDEGGAGGPKT
jgi:hypothetical protein